MRPCDQEYAGAHRFVHSEDAVPEACSTILMVGEDNPQSSDPRHALYPYPPGCAGNRLCDDILELSTGAYLACWRTNLCPSGRWSRKEADERANFLVNSGLAPWRVVLLFGKKVLDAINRQLRTPLESWKPAQVVTSTGTSLVARTYLSLPHPSGRNLAWNSTSVRQNARSMVQGLVPTLWE